MDLIWKCFVAMWEVTLGNTTKTNDMSRFSVIADEYASRVVISGDVELISRVKLFVWDVMKFVFDEAKLQFKVSSIFLFNHV